ncbi:TerC family protein [Moheibacter stercoris]|uniref:Tellurium resistance membrane protein TerC n=1 Tax=Moheibacter stercoris TaxID=1628251 RepID=A0ABV2LY24_9FLAO
MDFSIFMEPNAWMALLTLAFLEIVLGIDNIVFISILSGKLKGKDQRTARNVGLILAMFMRIGLLFGISWLMTLTKPIGWLSFDLPFMKGGFTGQSLIVFLGGLFLLYKSVTEIHHKLEDHGQNEASTTKKVATTLTAVIVQILAVDLVFSLDSVLTAVGMVTPADFGSQEAAMAIMVTAVVIAVLVMLIFAAPVSKFVNDNPTIQMLALSFLILIAVMLLAEAAHLSNLEMFGSHVSNIPKGYIYFAIFFSLGVEFLNMKMSKKKLIKLNNPEMDDSEIK